MVAGPRAVDELAFGPITDAGLLMPCVFNQNRYLGIDIFGREPTETSRGGIYAVHLLLGKKGLTEIGLQSH
jgi:hypothetical protein